MISKWQRCVFDTHRISESLTDDPELFDIDFHDGAWKAWSTEYADEGHVVLYHVPGEKEWDLHMAAPELVEAVRTMIDAFDHVRHCRICGESDIAECDSPEAARALMARSTAEHVLARAEGRTS